MYDCFEVLIPIEEIWCSPYQGFDFVIVMGVIAMIPDLKRRQQELGTEENNSQPQDSQAERIEIMPVAPRKSILRRLFHKCSTNQCFYGVGITRHYQVFSIGLLILSMSR